MSKSALLPDRTVIRLSGEDRYSFLQGIVTEDVEKLKTDPAIFTALLTPQGKVLFDFFVVNDGDALLIDGFKGAAEALVKRLTLYKLRAKVTLELAEDKAVAVSTDKIQGGFPDPRLAALGWRKIVGEALPADEIYDRRRIALGVPEFGKDFSSDEVFLTDVYYDVLNAVSYKKGCFIGQEVSSRMKRKGDIRRRTLVAAFDGPPPAKGAAVTGGASTLGEIMSGVDGAALALIRLDRWKKAKADGAAVECTGGELQLRFPSYIEQE